LSNAIIEHEKKLEEEFKKKNFHFFIFIFLNDLFCKLDMEN